MAVPRREANRTEEQSCLSTDGSLTINVSELDPTARWTLHPNQLPMIVVHWRIFCRPTDRSNVLDANRLIEYHANDSRGRVLVSDRLSRTVYRRPQRRGEYHWIADPSGMY